MATKDNTAKSLVTLLAATAGLFAASYLLKKRQEKRQANAPGAPSSAPASP